MMRHLNSCKMKTIIGNDYVGNKAVMSDIFAVHHNSWFQAIVGPDIVDDGLVLENRRHLRMDLSVLPRGLTERHDRPLDNYI